MRTEEGGARLPVRNAVAVFASLAVTVSAVARAANPSMGSIGTSGPTQLWAGTATVGVCATEAVCVEGVNCDTFTLNVLGQPSDWTGKQINIAINWQIPLNDYDLYVHKDSNSGPLVAQSAGGPPETMEATAIFPSASGTGAYTVHVVYFSVAAPASDQYQGRAAVAATQPATRVASYVSGGGITFTPNVRCKAPVAARDGEPSNRTDLLGNHYVTAIRGVPAGVDLWYFDLQSGSPTYDPYMRNPIYRGQPDSFTGSQLTSVGGDGGGDVDIAVGFGGNPPILAASSLFTANISVQRSTDKGVTFMKNPLGNTGGVLVDDRQWEQFLNTSVVYMLYRTVAPALTQIQRSNDGGLTFGPAQTAGLIGQVGAIDVDQNDGTVYVSGSTGQVCAGVPAVPFQEPVSTDYRCTQAASDPNGVAHIFFLVRVGQDGTAYVAYSNESDIFLKHSRDKGQTWSLPVRVNNGVDSHTNVLPALATGPQPGSVAVAWYGTTEFTNNDGANWQVFFAQSLNATADSPTFTQAVASDHFIHASNISEGGTLGNANRNLLDYFQISLDPLGAAVIDYTDDHNDFDGHTNVTRQISGPSIRGGNLPTPPPAPPVPPFDPNAPQVVDFRDDVADALLVVTPTDDPLDILSIKYSCEMGTDGPVIVAAMNVSDLSTIPPLSNWRMNFAANAPFSTLNPSCGPQRIQQSANSPTGPRSETPTGPSRTPSVATPIAAPSTS